MAEWSKPKTEIAGGLFELAKDITKLASGTGPDAACILLSMLRAEVLEILMITPLSDVQDDIMRAFDNYEKKLQDALR